MSGIELDDALGYPLFRNSSTKRRLNATQACVISIRVHEPAEVGHVPGSTYISRQLNNTILTLLPWSAAENPGLRFGTPINDQSSE